MRSFCYVRAVDGRPWAQVVRHFIGGDEVVELDFVKPPYAHALAYMRNIA